MQRQTHVRLLRHRQHRLHEVRVRRPDVLRRILPLKRLLFHFLPKVVHRKLPRPVPARRFDHRRRVRIRRVPVVVGNWNPQPPAIAQKLAVGLNQLVALALAQLHVQMPIRVVNTAEDPHVEPRQPVHRRLHELERRVVAELDPAPPDPQLTKKLQVLVRQRTDHHPVGQLDVRGIVLANFRLAHGRAGARRWRQRLSDHGALAKVKTKEAIEEFFFEASLELGDWAAFDLNAQIA